MEGATVPTFTKVVARDGSSYPVAGCRLVPVMVSRHDYIFECELRVITPCGNEFTIETGMKGYGKDRVEPNWMTEMQDRVTWAIMADERHLDLRLVPAATGSEPPTSE